jgi:ABC-2 type transport system permease protein
VTPSRVLTALPTLVRIGAAEMTAYRAEVLIWILTSTMPLVMLAIWDAVAADGPVGGLSQADLARYFTVTLVVRQLTSCWVVWELNQAIRTGSLSPQLLRPLSPLWFHAVRHWVALPLRIAVLLPMVALLVVWRPEMALPADPLHLAVAALASVLAWLVVFAFQVAFGALAFWSGQSLGLFNLWFGLWTIFGGYLMPLSVMPEAVQAVATYLPFRSMLSVPVEIAAGLLPPAAWPAALALQGAWVLGAGLIARLAWTRGLARYGAFGA